MRTTPLYPLACALLVFVGCTSPQHQDNSDEARAGIEAANAQFMEAMKQDDAAAVAALYTEDAHVMPPNGAIISGRENVQAWMQGAIDAGLEARLVADEVEGHGNTAHEVGTVTLMDASGQTVDEAKYLVIWKKEGDQWRLHRDIWNSNRPAAMPDTTAAEEEM